MSKPLQQRTFNSINKTIKQVVKDGRYNAESVAEIAHVSASTVRMIKRTETWPKYQAELSKRKKTRQTPAEAELTNDLKKIEDSPTEYVTVKQFHDAIAVLSGDVSNAKSVANIANGKADRAVKKSDDAYEAADDASTREHQNGRILRAIMQRKPGWFRRVEVEQPER